MTTDGAATWHVYDTRTTGELRLVGRYADAETAHAVAQMLLDAGSAAVYVSPVALTDNVVTVADNEDDQP